MFLTHRRYAALSISIHQRLTTALLIVVLLFVSGCATVDLDVPREASYAISPDTDTRLKRSVDGWLGKNPGPSGFYPLSDGTDALGVRLLLMHAADETSDVQYFLMKPDTAGIVFAAGLLAAAERGVRVRFLLDDIFTTINDRTLMLLDRHETIEVRLYNPVAGRGTKMFSFMGDFKRANRRMHTKSFVVDNQAMIVGGRNIADEYFGIETKGEFLDLDVVGIGPVAADVSTEFDRFWNDRRSIPLAAVGKPIDPDDLERARIAIERNQRDAVIAAMQNAQSTSLVTAMTGEELSFFSAHGRVITDAPEKLDYKPGTDHALLVAELDAMIESAEEEIILLTPYFVPGKSGLEYWQQQGQRDVRIVIVTNSLASNNHTAVHSGYSRYRKAIVEAGIELYEVRVDSGEDPNAALTLHTKAFVFDRKQLFVGSLNLDPRSIEINTEMGVVIDSPELASATAAAVDAQIPPRAWRVQLDDRGKLTWTSIVDGEPVVVRSEPQVGFGKKFQAFLLRIMPDSQL